MSVRLRLQRHGANKRPFYRLVAADQRAPRDGRYRELLGTYDPMKEPNVVDIDLDRVDYWLGVGAQPTDRAVALIKGFRAGQYITNVEFTEQNKAHKRAAQEAALNCKPLPEPEAPKAAAPAAEEAPAVAAAEEAPAAVAEEAPAAEVAEAPAEATENTEG